MYWISGNSSLAQVHREVFNVRFRQRVSIELLFSAGITMIEDDHLYDISIDSALTFHASWQIQPSMSGIGSLLTCWDHYTEPQSLTE